MLQPLTKKKLTKEILTSKDFPLLSNKLICYKYFKDFKNWEENSPSAKINFAKIY